MYKCTPRSAFFLIKGIIMTLVNDFISLSKIDEKIKEIELSKGDLPSRVKKLEEKNNNLNHNKITLNDKMIELDKNKKSFLNQKEDFDAKLEKYKDQLYLVKNNKEYDALNSEIDVIKNQLVEIKDSLSLIEKEKINFEEENKTTEIEIDECSKTLNKTNLQLEESMVDNKNEYKNLVKERDKLISNLDSREFQLYNRMLSAKGHGMVPVSSNACGNCFTVLPTQFITELKPNSEIKNCPSCSILLYYDE